jgi:two-component SAPR family response regulator
MGDVDASDGYYYESMRKFTVSNSFYTALVRAWLGLSHAYRFHVAGNFRKADTLNHQALDTFSQMKFKNFLPITCFQTALTAFYLANPSQGYEYAQKGILIATKQGIYDNQYAWLLYARALNRFGFDLGGQALSDAEESLDLFKVYENSWGQALVNECKGMIYSQIGDWNRALDAYQTGLKNLLESDLRRAPGPGSLALGLAEVLLENDQLDQARRTLEEHLQNIRISRFDLFRYHLMQARIENEKNGPNGAMPHIETALTIARENGYEAWLKPLRPWLTPLLVECHHQNKKTEDIEQLFIRAGRDADTALCLLRSNTPGYLGHAADRLYKTLPHNVPASLNICCLGDFSVSVGDRRIHKKQWRSAKAILLFKYLAVKNQRGLIPKEALLELAWPDEDPAVTNPRFHVALNSLRKLFEPDLQRGVPSAYILQRNNCYCLEIGPKGWIDFLEFLKVVDQAIALEKSESDLALACNLKAVSLYRGPLLEENPYDAWLAEDRELLRTKYLQTLARIIRLYEKQLAWHQCIEFCEIYLIHDKFAEPYYRKLMLLNAKIGNLPRVTQTFQRCQANINKELDCPLSHSTLELYKKIMKSEA